MTNQSDDKNKVQPQSPLTKVDEILERMRIATGAPSNKALAEILGLDPQATTNAKKKKAIPPIWLIRVSEISTYSVDWLLHGKGLSRREADLTEGPSAKCLSQEDFEIIPLLESKVTAGPEGEILFEEVADYYPFKRWWIEKMVGKDQERKSHLVLIKVRGDSMSPTINPGEVVMIDTWEAERINVRTGQIYVITMPDGSSAIKRLALSEKDERMKLICMSDNVADYRPFEFDLDPGRPIKFYVLGRVRWAGKEFD